MKECGEEFWIVVDVLSGLLHFCMKFAIVFRDEVDEIGDVARCPTFRWISRFDRTAENDFLEALFFVVRQTRRSA